MFSQGHWNNAGQPLIGAPRSCGLGHVTHIDPIAVAQVSQGTKYVPGSKGLRLGRFAVRRVWAAPAQTQFLGHMLPSSDSESDSDKKGQCVDSRVWEGHSCSVSISLLLVSVFKGDKG